MTAAIASHVRACFEAQGLMRHLGARMIEGSAGRCVLLVEHCETLTQQHGYFHAGVTAALLDTAGGHAALSLMPAGGSVLTVEFKTNLLAPAAGARLRAAAKVIRAGRTLTVVSGAAEVERDGAWTACAEMLGTMFALPGPEGPRTEEEVG